MAVKPKAAPKPKYPPNSMGGVAQARGYTGIGAGQYRTATGNTVKWNGKAFVVTAGPAAKKAGASMGQTAKARGYTGIGGGQYKTKFGNVVKWNGSQFVVTGKVPRPGAKPPAGQPAAGAPAPAPAAPPPPQEVPYDPSTQAQLDAELVPFEQAQLEYGTQGAQLHDQYFGHTVDPNVGFDPSDASSRAARLNQRYRESALVSSASMAARGHAFSGARAAAASDLGEDYKLDVSDLTRDYEGGEAGLLRNFQAAQSAYGRNTARIKAQRVLDASADPSNTEPTQNTLNGAVRDMKLKGVGGGGWKDPKTNLVYHWSAAKGVMVADMGKSAASGGYKGVGGGKYRTPSGAIVQWTGDKWKTVTPAPKAKPKPKAKKKVVKKKHKPKPKAHKPKRK